MDGHHRRRRSSRRPSVANGVVYVGSDDHKVYALDATTGAVKWTAATGARHLLVAGSGERRRLRRLRRQQGLRARRHDRGHEVDRDDHGRHVQSSPAVANGIVYVGSGDARLWAFDATTGATKWTGNTTGAVFSSPAVANGVVYVGSNDGKARTPTRRRRPRPTCALNPTSGMSPCQIQDAYRLPSQTDGTGRTVAIVDAYDNPNAEADLAVYRAQYGLPGVHHRQRVLQEAEPDRAPRARYPTGDTGWGKRSPSTSTRCPPPARCATSPSSRRTATRRST